MGERISHETMKMPLLERCALRLVSMDGRSATWTRLDRETTDDR